MHGPSSHHRRRETSVCVQIFLFIIVDNVPSVVVIVVIVVVRVQYRSEFVKEDDHFANANLSSKTEDVVVRAAFGRERTGFV